MVVVVVVVAAGPVASAIEPLEGGGAAERTGGANDIGERVDREALWGPRWMRDAAQNIGKRKPGLYPVIGFLGAVGKPARQGLVNNAAL